LALWLSAVERGYCRRCCEGLIIDAANAAATVDA